MCYCLSLKCFTRHNIMPSRFIQIANDRIFFSFHDEYYCSMCVVCLSVSVICKVNTHTHTVSLCYLFFFASENEHLDCLHILVTMNVAGTAWNPESCDIRVSHPLDMYLVAGLWHHIVAHSILFSEVLPHYYL